MYVRIQEKDQDDRYEELNRLVTTIGKGSKCDIELVEGEPSQRMAMFIKQDADYNFKPLLDDGTVRMDGNSLDKMVLLKPGETVVIGAYRISLCLHPESQLQSSPSTEDKPQVATPPPIAKANPSLGRVGALQAYQGMAMPAPTPSSSSQQPEKPSVAPELKEPEPTKVETSNKKLNTCHYDFLKLLDDQELGYCGSYDNAPDSLQEKYQQYIRQFKKDGKDSALVQQIEKQLWKYIVTYGPLNDSLSDTKHDFILINGAKHIGIHHNNLIENQTPVFINDEHLALFAKQLIMRSGQPQSNAMTKVHFKDGTYAEMLLPPLRSNGVAMTIKKSKRQPLLLDDLVKSHFISLEICDFLKLAISENINLIVCGNDASGKSTLLSSLVRHCCEIDTAILLQEYPDIQITNSNCIQIERGSGSSKYFDFIHSFKKQALFIDDLHDEEVFPLLNTLPKRAKSIVANLSVSDTQGTLRYLEHQFAKDQRTSDPYWIHRFLSQHLGFVVECQQNQIGERRCMSVSEILLGSSKELQRQKIFEFRNDPESGNADFIRCGPIPAFIEKKKMQGDNIPFKLFRETDA